MFRAFALALAFAVLSGCASETGPYPSKEIRIIVQAAPGGLSDQVSRIMGSLVEKDVGVPVVAENKPGASGALAFSYVARQPPSGYIIGHSPVELAMVRTLGYTDIGPRDMTLICRVSLIPPVLVVRGDAPWKDFAEFIAAAKARPGELIMANSGAGSIWHFNALLLEANTAIQVTHLPYNGSGGTLVSLLGGHVDAVIAGVSEVLTQVQSGDLRALAVFDSKRSSVLPDAPTSYELGYPMGAPAWSAFSGPPGMDPAIREKLAAAFAKASTDPLFLNLCADRGIEPAYLGPADFEAFAKQQADYFAEQLPLLLGMKP